MSMGSCEFGNSTIVMVEARLSFMIHDIASSSELLSLDLSISPHDDATTEVSASVGPDLLLSVVIKDPKKVVNAVPTESM